MIPIEDARKKLKQVGTSKAESDALRFMYANLLAFEQGLSTQSNSIDWPIPDFYTALGKVPNDKIYDEVARLRRKFNESMGLRSNRL